MNGCTPVKFGKPAKPQLAFQPTVRTGSDRECPIDARPNFRQHRMLVWSSDGVQPHSPDISKLRRRFSIRHFSLVQTEKLISPSSPAGPASTTVTGTLISSLVSLSFAGSR